jgi:hypothetical protein
MRPASDHATPTQRSGLGLDSSRRTHLRRSPVGRGRSTSEYYAFDLLARRVGVGCPGSICWGRRQGGVARLLWAVPSTDEPFQHLQPSHALVVAPTAERDGMRTTSSGRVVAGTRCGPGGRTPGRLISPGPSSCARTAWSLEWVAMSDNQPEIGCSWDDVARAGVLRRRCVKGPRSWRTCIAL